MNGYLIALIVFIAWIVFVYVLNKTKWLERHNMSLMGPMIMMKTQKGRDLIDRVAQRKRLWTFYGKLSFWICAGSMITIMVLLLWEATIVDQIEKAPSPELILGIPGINPVIPLGYGILGLVVAIVVHELAHGIMTRLGNLKLVSLGVLFFVFPVGAFVEPDDTELRATTRKNRARVFAAGPATNMIVAIVVLSLFSGVMMASVEPAEEGALAMGVVEGSPINFAGVTTSSVITSIDGVGLSSADDLDDISSIEPGSLVDVEYTFSGEHLTVTEVVYGLVVSYTVRDYAANTGGFHAGMVILSLNDTELRNMDDLRQAMTLTHAGQVVNVTMMSYDEVNESFRIDETISSLTLSDKYDFYEEFYPSDNEDSFSGKGYLGAGFLSMGLDVEDADYYAAILAHPFEGDRNLDDFSKSWLRLIALPFLDLAPLRSPVTDLYEPGGAFAWMPAGTFWILTNSLYWIFWLNLMLGLTNVLPAVPLDGGYLFRDSMDYFLSKVRKGLSAERREKAVGNLTLMFALSVLFLILWQLIGPTLLN